MNVLVIGGAGYVGTSLMPQLLERGYKVRVFDNLMFGGDALLPFFRNRNFSFVKGDVRNAVEVQAAVNGQDIIVHLAAIVGYPACRKDPKLAADVNVGGTQNVAAAASRSQVVLFGSTGAITAQWKKSARKKLRLTLSASMGKPRRWPSATIGQLLDRRLPVCHCLAFQAGCGWI